MRKIEKLMINAINSDKAFAAGNTLVTMHSIANGYMFKVFLHGNHIANVYRSNTFDVNRIEFSFAGWQTPTTKSRINALFNLMSGINGCYQKGGKLFFRAAVGAFDNHIEITPNGWHSYVGAILQRLASV
jgi:hypothetical protein